MSSVLKYQAISPLEELLAYEALWDNPASSVRVLSEKLKEYPQSLASALVEPKVINHYKKQLLPIIH